MSMQKITQPEDLDAVLEETPRFFLYKNSTTCPISTEAFEEVRSYTDAEDALKVVYLNVQERATCRMRLLNGFKSSINRHRSY